MTDTKGCAATLTYTEKVTRPTRPIKTGLEMARNIFDIIGNISV